MKTVAIAPAAPIGAKDTQKALFISVE